MILFNLLPFRLQAALSVVIDKLTAYLVTQRLLPEEPRSRRLMTSDQDTKVVAEPQVQQVQEAKENSHLEMMLKDEAPLQFSALIWPAVPCSCVTFREGRRASGLQTDGQTDESKFSCLCFLP
ncbi:hypothetical protein L3Q82_006040 [Scortum barcoo]|uniref:Uncharacterized protein n=1 Tax=Scortum barcoo TaxID=214431 RepID=A0ACB8X1I6_9TELE|nr:hypothetical protein L3Q82_006040 [Scortum barcoo]